MPSAEGPRRMGKKKSKAKKLKKSCCEKPLRKICKRCPRWAKLLRG